MPAAMGVFRALNRESNVFGSLLLLADNYNHSTDDPTTEAQSAQRTHRDFLSERSDAVHQLADPCALPAAASGSRSAVVAAGARVPAALVGSPPVGPAWAALSSGRAELTGKHSCSGAQEAGRAW